MKSINRRKFITLASLSAVFAGTTLKTLTAAAKKKAAMVTSSHPSVAALNYIPDADKATRMKDKKTAATAAVSGVAVKKQYCTNCKYYNGSGKTAPCLMFGNLQVPTKAWCSVWAKK